MGKDSPQKIKTCRSPALKRDREGSSSTTNQSAASSRETGGTGRTKRKASPKRTQDRKRARVSESEPQNTFEEDLRVRVLKRKVREYGEGPSNETKRKKRGGLDHSLLSSSADSDRESGSSTSEGGNRTGKRKAAADGKGPHRKKRRSLGLIETEDDTRQDLSEDAQRAKFVAKYREQNQLGEGGCGSVFAGYRKADRLPVAIKHIPKDKVFCKQTDNNGRKISVEVAVMLKLTAETTGSVGSSAPVSLLDWYDLKQELILVLERPVPSKDLLKYIEVNGGSLQEEEARIILKQLVDAAKELQDKDIFHRDIKVENILIETGSDVPRVRLIDFGLSCFVKKTSFYRVFYGTSAYIPPEWYSRSTYRAGPTTVWQLGVVLFESLHCKSTFETSKFLGKTLKISNKLSDNCQDFLRTCLTKAPEHRPTLEQLKLHPWLR